MRLEGKTALVTGGSAGIGFAAARAFAMEGASVYITGRRQQELDDAATALGPRVTAVRADAASVEDLDRLYAQIASERGHLDVLYANAGFYEFARLGEINEAHYDRHFDTNVKGLLFTVQKALPLMRRGASVILTGSIVASRGVPAFSVYSATKAAVRAFARGWAVDLKERGIRVNVISPGPIDTPGLEGLAGSPQAVDPLKRELAATVPLGRMGLPEEIARAAVFLASDEASFVTGAELAVDGGAGQV
ncbi:MAG TPA: glucose 1-dehydrogenase [Frateuria sp.]|uniref:glucose 1-dehydrogenase n=1 Tax=Frateuria sp. TaxID=2211372 RepID=UPI002D7F9F91|nr:glucose 1-dehydrogenase [Frateuria sp.]HET6803938.1 glucose 1-dehydrogenase [Frateuria sp.]